MKINCLPLEIEWRGLPGLCQLLLGSGFWASILSPCSSDQELARWDWEVLRVLASWRIFLSPTRSSCSCWSSAAAVWLGPTAVAFVLVF